MNTQLTAIAAKIKTWRLAAGSQSAKPLVNDIYKAIFQGEFYREVWDEPILPALQELTRENPPHQDVYGQQLQFLKERTTQVVAINDLFCLVLLPTNEVSAVLERIASL